MPKISALCCNPFNEKGHNNHKKNLRPVSQWMIEIKPSLTLNQKVCDKCRKKIAQVQISDTSSTEYDDDLLHSVVKRESENVLCDSDIQDIAASEALERLNASLQSVGESPIKKKRLCEAKYPKEKLVKVTSTIQSKVLLLPSEEEVHDHEESEIISQLKDKFRVCTSRSKQMEILTILPKSWSVKKLQDEFNITNYMARRVKDLVKAKGILSSPNPKPGKTLDQTTADLVRNFYCSDDISRAMPGKKDFVTVRHNGEKLQVQKRLVLSNLKKMYVNFKDNHPELRIGFLKFANLRPKNCVLAGSSGTHCVCVCTIHQNFKLMLTGCNIPQLTKGEDNPIKTYKDCIARVVCNPSLPACHFGECKFCPDPETFKTYLQDLLNTNDIDNITYQQWVSVDHTSLETIIKSSDNFIDCFFDKLKSLTRHSFIASQQSTFQNGLRNELKEGEVLAICDLSENYSFVIQDKVQGYHWTNMQATIHPIVAYYKDGNKLEHTSLVIISECLTHDTVAVHLFQSYLMDFLTVKFGRNPEKIYYFSDGAAAHYKNRKNFINLCHHEEDFQTEAEWHFSATSHGKGASDGVGGTVKRLAARASLQRPYSDQIMTPKQLYTFAKDNIEGMNFKYATKEDHKNEEMKLMERFEKCCKIVGTQKLYTFIPFSKDKVITKVYSNSDESKIERVAVSDSNAIPFNDIKGYVACDYNGYWWLTCVLEKNQEKDEITVSFLHPHGPSPSFTFPSHPDILSISSREVVAIVNPQTATGRTYTLSSAEMLMCNRLISYKYEEVH